MPLHANGVGGGSSATKIWLHVLVRAIDTGAASECDSKSKLTTKFRFGIAGEMYILADESYSGVFDIKFDSENIHLSSRKMIK